MEKMINLRDLLVHEVQDLYSAEEQIIEALPAMIEKANNKQLKNALQDHLKVTQQQKNRLDQVKELLLGPEENQGNGQQKGLFSRLFGGGAQKCRGTEGLIEEGEKMMGENMTPEVMDAAIISCAQKIEHYEICGYGTARAYARELGLGDVAELLEETLDEEYEADDLLTDLAVGRLNEEAQNATDDEEEGEKKSRGRGSSGGNSSKKASSRGASSKSPSSKSSSSKSSSSRSNGSSKSNGSSRSNGSARGKSASASKSSSGGRKSGGSTAKKSSGGSRGKSSASKSKGSRAKSR